MYNAHMNKIGQVAVINVKVNSSVKREAMELAEELGITLSAFINASLKHFVRVKSVYFYLDREIPNAELIEALKISRNEIENGLVSPTFDKAEDAMTWLNNPTKKYVNES